MGADGTGRHSETHTVRLSARTTQSNHDKLIGIAKDNGWVNAQGRPNISKVLNFVIESFEEKGNKRGRREADDT